MTASRAVVTTVAEGGVGNSGAWRGVPVAAAWGAGLD